MSWTRLKFTKVTQPNGITAERWTASVGTVHYGSIIWFPKGELYAFAPYGLALPLHMLTAIATKIKALTAARKKASKKPRKLPTKPIK